MKAMVLLALAPLGACVPVQTSGPRPLHPSVDSGTVESVQPELRWEAPMSPGVDVTYELRIWLDGEIVYERNGLVAPHHRIEQPLRKGETYTWTVRAWALLDGRRRRCTQWGQRLEAGPASYWGDGRVAYPLITPP